MALYSNQLYSLLARWYDFWVGVIGYKRAVEYFVDQLPFSTDTPLRVLDAGCATGLISQLVLRRFPRAEIVAFDFNEKMIGKLQSKISGDSRVQAFVGDIQDVHLPLAEESFDLIMTGGVLEYLPLEASVKNLARFLKPQGYFANLALKDAFSGKAIAVLFGCKVYTQEQNKKAFTTQGFSFEQIFSLSWFFPFVFKEAHLFRKVA